MKPDKRLGATFLAHLPGGPADRPPPADLDAVLDRLCATASAAWPGLTVAPADFVAHLAARIPSGADLGRALADLHAADLYLACACLHNAAGALRRFEECHGVAIAVALRRLDRSASFVDEVRQEVREKLFMGKAGAAPRIAQYAGRGPLAGWLDVLAHRTGLNALRSRKGDVESSEHAEALLAPSDPELDALRAGGQAQLRAAFQAAAVTLTPHERMILQLCFVRGLSHEKIGAMYNIHQATVSRRLLKARETLLEGMKGYYRDHLGMSVSDLNAMADLLGSRLDLSLSRWLGEGVG